ncbi:hypothetical protein GCM10009608_53490 [Pseudonocardia alaniniphila]
MRARDGCCGLLRAGVDQPRATGAAQSALACRRRSTWRRAFSVAAWDIPDIVAERHRPEAVAAVTVSDEFLRARHFDGHFPSATE